MVLNEILDECCYSIEKKPHVEIQIKTNFFKLLELPSIKSKKGYMLSGKRGTSSD